MTEPKLPAPCAVLNANLTPRMTPGGGTLTDGVERHYRDTDRLEKAMRHCPAGQAVVLRTGPDGKSVFLVGPVRLSANVTLIVEAGVAVWGSRDPRNYDVAPGSCGVVTAERGPGCKPLFLAQDAPNAGIMGDGVIDGRGGARLIPGGGRESETWWELAHRAKVEDAQQAVSRLLIVRRSNNFTLYRITLRNSPNCHVSTEATDGFTAWGVKIDTPKWARNTDGIDPQGGTSNVSIIDSFIRAGDDNISPKASDTTGPVTHMTVRNVHFYDGHGFGIGSVTSGGLNHIVVNDLTVDGSDNGLRIKSDRSRGGLVEDVQFTNVCIRNSPNPIVLNPFYTTFEGNKIPVYRRIALHNVHILTPGAVVLRGLDAEHLLDASLTNVRVNGMKPEELTARFATLSMQGGNLEPTGEDVTVHRGGLLHSGVWQRCAKAFVPFPENTSTPPSAEVIPPADQTFYVAADGTGDYYSVQAAINKVPATGGLVLVAPGTYRERVLIKQNHVTLKSANADPAKTTIVYDLSQGTQGMAVGFATVRVTGDDFTAENLTMQNDFNRTHKQEQQGSQARALALLGDRNVVRNSRILANQDTLFMSAKNCVKAEGGPCDLARSYFVHDLIAGNVDFIYGDGTAYFDDCELRSTEHAAGGFLTAQGKHYEGQQSLFVFRNAQLTAEPGVGNVYLGRPWKDYAAVVFLAPRLGPHIAGEWREWHPGETHKLDTAFYRVYRPVGAGGAGFVNNSQQLTPEQAARYTPREVLAGKDGWVAEAVR